MSVQFGKCNFDGKPIDPKDLDRVRAVITPYGPDGEGYLCKDNFGILYRAFHTTKESRLEHQPHVSASGAVITWDGRLDNREQLLNQLEGDLSNSSTDLSIVAAAYKRWGQDAFAKLIGDWAISIWDPHSQSLIFAKDIIGTRHLYYSVEKNEVTWCTILDPLVLFAGRSFPLEGEYVAGWLSTFPAAHLTPYVGIHSVAPSSSVCLKRGKQTSSQYWNFDPARTIRYRADGEYEEHFRSVFSEAVRRRLRSDSPVIAELSGGMDSSSIVCMADMIMDRGVAETARLDTVSYYDDSEPNWNERPFFTKVEEKRGRAGCHIDVGSADTFRVELERAFAATPASLALPNEATKQFAAYMTSHGNRVLLSGIGGDEATGGIPTPTPELEDLLARARIWTLASHLKIWALNKRKPWLHLLLETARGFCPPSLVNTSEFKRPAPWLQPGFVKANRFASRSYETRRRWFGPLPSFQENIATLEVLRRQFSSECLLLDPPHERRYPYLDRSLLEFIYAIPRDQLVRPGQRRSLMRRALMGIVPDELLNRKRKAFVARLPMAAIARDWDRVVELSQQMVSSNLGIVDADVFRQTVQRVRRCQEVPIVTVMRTLGLELWLRGLKSEGLLAECPSSAADAFALMSKRTVLTRSVS